MKNNQFRFIAVIALCIGLSCSAPGADAAKPEVNWAGVAFRGAFNKITMRFPFLHKVDQTGRKSEDGVSFFNKLLTDYLRENYSKLNHVNLNINGGKNIAEVPYVLAFSVVDEQVLMENLGSIRKLVIQLGFELIVVDMREQNLISSIPIFIEFRDASEKTFSPKEIQDRLLDMVNGPGSQLFEVLDAKINHVRLLGKNQGTLRVKNVAVGEKSYPFLPDHFKENENKKMYEEIVAHQFGTLLASQAQVAILPYLADSLKDRLAYSFSDNEVLQIKIPEPTYALGLHLRGFKKVLAKETRAEKLWVYGAFLDVKLYEPEFDETFYSEAFKYGVQKITPATQIKTDDYPIVSEAFKGVCLKAIEQLEKNKKSSNQIKKCKY